MQHLSHATNIERMVLRLISEYQVLSRINPAGPVQIHLFHSISSVTLFSHFPEMLKIDHFPCTYFEQGEIRISEFSVDHSYGALVVVGDSELV